MELYYLLIVGVLFLLAISDLIVGVANDAVNFLNSAIGSKAAPFRVIIVIASIGILLGAVFSEGMMEVARKGIFNPEMFSFSDIMVLFLAVMLANVLLLDFFNTFGLPTSTTVSIVFSLLGSAVAVSTFKLARMGELASKLGDYLNVERTVVIITGIFLSVILAFTFGTIIMYIVRMAFSFNIPKTSRYWSGIWSGFAITTILYFLIMKGAEGSALVTEEMLLFIQNHTFKILLISFAGWTILFQIFVLFTKVNVLKITVLVGTFALAMAFAGNDMVNFIGVPLAGFEAFRTFSASGSGDAGGFLMESLREPVNTPVYFLIIAGLVMILTLRFSKKARTVTETEVNLGRQGEGSERFGSSIMARFIVRRSLELTYGLSRITPKYFNSFLAARFNEKHLPVADKKQAFDLVRASVNLVVSSILIALGTSNKLPLSTTYVTFMVAMGTSLADGAWGRESAVYRITGVLTVIGGWFFTAFIAFTASFIIATLIYFGKLPVILALIAISVFILLRTHALHRRRTQKKVIVEMEANTTSHVVLSTCNDEVKRTVLKVSKILYLTYTNFFKEHFKELKKLKKEAKELSREVKEIRERIPETLRQFNEAEFRSGHHYVQVVEYMKEMTTILYHITLPAYNHLDNNHPVDKEQAEELVEFNDKTSEFFNYVINTLKNRKANNHEELNQRRDEIIKLLNNIQLNRIKILKKTKGGVKVGVAYMEMLNETKNLVLNVVHLVKANMNLMEGAAPEKKEVLPEVPGQVVH